MLALAGSGPAVGYFVVPNGSSRRPPKPPSVRFGPSTDIGKCESFITVTFVLLNAPEGIAIVFTAKSLMRAEQIRRNAGFCLGGTLVNLVLGPRSGGVARVMAVGA